MILGEQFVNQPIIDHQQDDLVVGMVSLPASWHLEYHVNWNYKNISAPLTTSDTFTNPANTEAVFGFGNYLFFDLPGRGPKMFRPGQNYGGLIFGKPMSPLNTLTQFIKHKRGDVQNLTFVGSKDMPDLAAAMKMPPEPNQHGIAIKVSYDLNGVPIDEEFYAVSGLASIPYHGPMGTTYQTNWGLMGVHSFRAPAGTIDARREIFAAIAKSFRPNPKWQERVQHVNAYLAGKFDRAMKAEFASIAAAGARSRAISAQSDAFIAGIERQRAAQSSGNSATVDSTERSANDHFDDYIRGVDTTSDPYWGQSQHDNTQQYHWTDGYGSYRNTNDVNANPNQTENGSWTLMTNQ